MAANKKAKQDPAKATDADEQKANKPKNVKVKLINTVQIEPGKDPLTPGEHTLPADIAAELKKEGLAK